MDKFSLLHAKALYLRFCALYGHKFTKDYHDDDFKSIWYNEWCLGMATADMSVIKDALEHCKAILEWPPSLAEFRRICDEKAGLPKVSQALQAAINRDFSHPTVFGAYQKVGSFAMKNDSHAELFKKFESAYNEAISEWRKDPNIFNEQLKLFHVGQFGESPPQKLLTHTEKQEFKEQFKNWRESAAKDKAARPSMAHPVFDKTKLVRNTKDFDDKLFNERKKYLLSLNEAEATTLPMEDWYDRCRYLREIASLEHLRMVGHRYIAPEEKIARNENLRAKTIYKHWMSD